MMRLQSNKELGISGYHLPSSECCGDWWGRIPLGSGIEQVIIADATGHGAAAVLVTAMIYSTVTALTQISTRENRRFSPKEIMSILNEVINVSLNGKMLATCLIMEFDTNTKKVIYANAGHCHPFVLVSNSDDSRFSKSTGKSNLKTLIADADKRSDPVGMEANQPFYNCELEIRPGDRFFIYSDGAVEFKTEFNKPYGTRGLRKTLLKHEKLELDGFRDHVATDLQDEIRKGVADDDFTFVVVDVANVASGELVA